MENEALPLENTPTDTEVILPEGIEADAAEAPDIRAEEEGDTAGTERNGADAGRAADFAATAAEDLCALRGAVPELAELTSLSELADPGRYGELREAGLSPVEAFCASHSEMLLGRRRDNRAHLGSSIGRTASAPGGRIGAAALSEARDLFPSLSDREIETLYRRVTSTR